MSKVLDSLHDDNADTTTAGIASDTPRASDARAGFNGHVGRKPTIHIRAGELPQQVEQGAAALLRARRPIYDFAGSLVMVERRQRSACATSVPVRAVRIAAARLYYELAKAAHWTKTVNVSGEFKDVPANPPRDVSETLLSGAFPVFPSLTRIVTTPVLLPNGELVTTPGYHEASGLLFDPNGVTFPDIPDAPTREEAEAALAFLDDFLCDFPFANEAAHAAALAALLTPTVRSAIDGPVPMFLVHAHVAGTGKGKLVNVAGIIATGAPVPCMPMVDEAEFEKRILSALLAGQSLVVLDNIVGKVGSGTLDALLTTDGEWSGRILGRSETANLPMQLVVYVTGNNCAFRGDLTRRCIPVFLEAKEERPEHRTGFRHLNLLAHVKRMRPEAVAAVLTIVKAYLTAGAPDVPLQPLGSFEAWTAMVRAPLVWLGCADPVQGQETLREEADSGLTAWGDALAALAERFGGEPFTAATVAQEVQQSGAGLYAARDMFGAVIRGGDLANVTGRNLAAVFTRRRGQIVGGLVLRKSAELRRNDGFLWTVDRRV